MTCCFLYVPIAIRCNDKKDELIQLEAFLSTSSPSCPNFSKNRAGTKTRTILICSLVIGATLISSAAFIWAVMRWKRKEAVVVAAKEEEDSCEVERGHVEMGAELGKGCFGTVFKGTFKDLRQV